jgi:FHS family Na+ dependent glucose MFS transporter 1
MQILHFCYAFGAFIAPLVARQFISGVEEDDSNSTNSTSLDALHYPGSGCCQNNNSMEWSHNSTELEQDNESFFRVAYWIVSALFVPTLLAMGFYSIKYDILGVLHRKENNVLSDDILTQDEDEEERENGEEEVEVIDLVPRSRKSSGLSVDANGVLSDERKETSLDGSQPLTPRHQSTMTKGLSVCLRNSVVVVLATFLLVYVGMELAYGSWIFTVVVTGPLKFSKSQGAVIQSLFWGTFSLVRLFSVVLALLNIKASVMMVGNLSGSLIASVIMVSFPHNAPAIWLASAVLGTSYASIFPTAMTWISETIGASGAATSIVITGGIVGEVSIPAITGALLYKVSPDVLFYMTFVSSITSSIFMGFLLLLAHLYKKEVRSVNIGGPHSGEHEEEVNLVDSDEGSGEEETTRM